MSNIEIKEDVNERNSPESTSSPGNERHEHGQAINAMNWSLGMKLYHTAIPCFLAFLM